MYASRLKPRFTNHELEAANICPQSLMTQVRTFLENGPRVNHSSLVFYSLYCGCLSKGVKKPKHKVFFLNNNQNERSTMSVSASGFR